MIISVNLTAEVATELATICAEESLNRSALINKLVEEWINERKRTSNKS